MQENVFKNWVLSPLNRIAKKPTTSVFVLFGATITALFFANSPFSEQYLQIWETKISFKIHTFEVEKSLLKWINDGLMSIFFFVIGLELKREIIAGELSQPKKAIVPILGGIGGMVLPALVYVFFTYNFTDESLNGWGIPMATDIAFSLGVLYLLGNKVPTSIKIFILALAIIDDIGAVLVIAFFYTSDISINSLMYGGVFFAVMILLNILKIRSTYVYGIIGIFGLWMAFLLSGIHATIAAVLAAFTIPSYIEISRDEYAAKMKRLAEQFRVCESGECDIATYEEKGILEQISQSTYKITSPLQNLESFLHPIVSYVVLPIFALANAGVALTGDVHQLLLSPITLGVGLGLLLGKVFGIVGIIFIAHKLKLIKLPRSLSYKNLFGVSLLTAIGFTMSLFITSLAFETPVYLEKAKIGILIASLLGGFLGYFVLKRTLSAEDYSDEESS